MDPAIARFLEQLCAAGAFGQVRLVLQAGRVTHVSLDQSWKPEELPEQLGPAPAKAGSGR